MDIFLRLPHTTGMEKTEEDEQLLESLEIEELKKDVDSLILKVKTLSEQLRQQETQQFKSPPRKYHDTYRNDHAYYHRRQQHYNNGDYSHRQSDVYHHDQQTSDLRQPPHRQRSEASPMCFWCGQYGHYQWQCRVRVDHLNNTYNRRHVVGNRSANRNLNLVGSPNEANVIVGGKYCTALIDTGSCVSTICESYYKQFLSFCQIQPVDRILRIECADGKHLPYLGFIETTIALAAPGDINLQCLL